MLVFSSKQLVVDKLTHCPECYYDLQGLPGTHVCPECGLEYDDNSRIYYMKNALTWKKVIARALFTLFWISLISGSAGMHFMGILYLPLLATIVLAANLIPFYYRKKNEKHMKFDLAVTPQGITYLQDSSRITLPWENIKRVLVSKNNRAGIIKKNEREIVYVPVILNNDETGQFFMEDATRRIEAANAEEEEHNFRNK